MALQVQRGNELDDHIERMLRNPLPVYVLFVNTTKRTLDLYWVRGAQTERIQFTLKPNTGVPVNTFNTHIWFFRDYFSGEAMHVYSKRLFFPVPMRVPRDPKHPEELTDARAQIMIQFPVRTLKENCLWLIVRWLRRTVMSPRACVNHYVIPLTLKIELHLLLDSIEVYCGLTRYNRQRYGNHHWDM